MTAWNTDSAAWIYVSCFGLSIVSALLPWFNGEVIVLSLAAMRRSPLDLVALALLAASGQVAGKCLLYWLATQTGRLRAAHTGRVERWRERLQGRRLRAIALVFLSSTLGIPPLYVTTIAAGAVGMAFPRFIGAAACGRVVRFCALVFCPRLLLGLIGR